MHAAAPCVARENPTVHQSARMTTGRMVTVAMVAMVAAPVWSAAVLDRSSKKKRGGGKGS